MPKFCTNCGNPLSEGSNFCTQCGQKVTEASYGRRAPGANSPSQAHQQAPPIPPRTYKKPAQNLDIFFYIPMGVCGIVFLVTLSVLGKVFRAGLAVPVLLGMLLVAGICYGIWAWPFKQYKLGNTAQAKKGVLVFSCVFALSLLLDLARGEVISMFLDVVSIGSLVYLYHKLS